MNDVIRTCLSITISNQQKLNQLSKLRNESISQTVNYLLKVKINKKNYAIRTFQQIKYQKRSKPIKTILHINLEPIVYEATLDLRKLSKESASLIISNELQDIYINLIQTKELPDNNCDMCYIFNIIQNSAEMKITFYHNLPQQLDGDAFYFH